MASQSTIFALLKFYANRMNTATIDYYEFITYVKKYAQIHVEEQPDLVTYLGNADPVIDKDLEALTESKQVVLQDKDKKRIIYFLPLIIQKYTRVYQEIQTKPTTPFPSITDLPKAIPLDILTKVSAQDYLATMLKNQELNDKSLFSVSLPHEIPSIIVPSSLSVDILGNICVAKIRNLLLKDEYHEYFSKKLRISNPGKELACKNFFDKFVHFSDNLLNELKKSTDSFYFWTQLCYFIRQDYESIKDFTPEDVNILQAIYIAEIITSIHKDKIKNEHQKEEALEALKQALEKPPYYFTMQDILNFTNSKSVPLTKLYSADDLKNFLEHETSESEDEGTSKLPKLLVFKISSGTRYFIYKDKIVPLIIRLCNEAHDTISQIIKDQWVESLRNFNKLPEMTSFPKFEEMLRAKIEKLSPVLYALLNANFLLMLTYELRSKNAEVQLSLFDHDKLLPYSSLLLIRQQDLLANAKIELPFWYSIPILSWIMSLFMRKPAAKHGHHSPASSTAFQKVYDEIPSKPSSRSAPVSKGKQLAQKAQNLEKHFVQEGSTVEREMVSYLKIWNKMIDKQARANLEEDVNSLIRDYIRKVVSTLHGVTFDEARLENLARTLCSTPNMKKIGEPEALKMYVQMYIIHLLKSLS